MRFRTLLALVVACAASLANSQDPPRADPPSPEERAKAAEASYLEALRIAKRRAEDPKSTKPDVVLDAIQKALEKGACPTRTLIEGAFADLHSLPRFRELIKVHARQHAISMRLPGEPGEALRITGRALDTEGEPVAGALVYLYHTDAKGEYTRGGMDERNPRLFGYLRTDAEGKYSVLTIRPAPYRDTEGVDQHVHFEVQVKDLAPRALRMGFSDDPLWREKELPAWVAKITRSESGEAIATYDLDLKRSAAMR